MKQLISLLINVVFLFNCAYAVEKPWSHGNLKVSDNSLYLSHADGTPFFWLGDTGWLLPERLNRDEAAYYLQRCGSEGFNVVQVQVVNDVPAFNIYGKMSMPKGFDSRILRGWQTSR